MISDANVSKEPDPARFPQEHPKVHDWRRVFRIIGNYEPAVYLDDCHSIDPPKVLAARTSPNAME
jgi:hypothetical protein